MRIWLDDVREAPDGWHWLRTGESLIAMLDYAMITQQQIQYNPITLISLDHDLGDGVKTGYDVVCYIEKLHFEKGFILPEMCIHSANPVGRKNMQAAIDSMIQRAREHKMFL